MSISIFIAFIIGMAARRILGALVAWTQEPWQQPAAQSLPSSVQSGGESVTPPRPASLWPVPEAVAQTEIVCIAASTVEIAERIHETASLLNSLTEEAYERGLGIAMKLERDYDEELFGQEERPTPYELKVLVYQPLRFTQRGEEECCGGAHPPPPPRPCAHLSPSAPRRAGPAERR